MKKKKLKAETRRVEDMPGYIDTAAMRPPRPVFRGRNIQGERGWREGRFYPNRLAGESSAE